jgi:hypothetical protein
MVRTPQLLLPVDRPHHGKLEQNLIKHKTEMHERAGNRLALTAGFGVNQSNLTFYEESSYLLAVGLNYKF